MLLSKSKKIVGKTHMKFKDESVKSVFIQDDMLTISYQTKQGNIEQVVFPDIADADYFFSNTLQGYRNGHFSVQDLERFFQVIQVPLTRKILSADTGFGRCSNIAYARFVIAQAIATLNATRSSQKAAVNHRISAVQGARKWK